MTIEDDAYVSAAEKATKRMKKILGAGVEVHISCYDGEGRAIISWRKRGGHAGSKRLTRMADKAKALGFKPVEITSNGTPDGSRVGSGDLLADQHGNKLTLSRSYGIVAYDNWFSAELTLSDEFIRA